MCNPVSNKQIEKRKFYTMNQNSIIDFTRDIIKVMVMLHCVVENMTQSLHAKMSTS